VAAQVGNQGGVAKALEYMGYGYLGRGDYGMHMMRMGCGGRVLQVGRGEGCGEV
jgi:hypothetical protein